MDIYHRCPGQAVIRRILEIGQTFKTYFQTGSSSKSGYLHIFFLIAFLDEAFSRNIIIKKAK